MSRNQQHIIRSERVELAVTGTESDGFALQGKLAALCRDWLTPVLEEMFARVVPDDVHWSFERIEVDIGHFTLENFERDFVKAVAAAVEKQIGGRATALSESVPGFGNDGPRRLTNSQSIREAWLHFLATGVLPWWFHLPAGQTLEEALIASWREADPSDVWTSALLDSLASPVARQRLARQFSPALLELLLQSHSPVAAKTMRDFVAHGEVTEHEHASESPQNEKFFQRPQQQAEQPQFSDTPQTRHPGEGRDPATFPPDKSTDAHSRRSKSEENEAFYRRLSEPAWQAIFALIASRQPVTLDNLAAQIERAEREAADASIVLAQNTGGPRDTVPPSRIDLVEGIFVNDAGIVLLHPFLPTLFERLHVTANNQLIQPDRALALLHYLATGARQAPEYALVLPKLLCGLTPDALIGAPVELTEDETNEADDLLKAVIGHWNALGDASPDALRGTFLTRPGKLSKRGDDDVLQVESQSFDVLLDRLPWAIGMIYLPWMTRFLWVEWRS